MQLDYLLGSLGRNIFVNDYWDKKILHVSRENPSYYNHILNYDQVDEYIKRRDIRYPAVKLYKGGAELEQSEFLFPLVTDGFSNEHVFFVPDFESKRNNGASVVISALKNVFPAVAYWQSSLENELRFPVELTAIMHSQVVNDPEIAHDENVFIMQLHGWTNIELISSGIANSGQDDDILLSPIILNAGDLLFVPKGFKYKICGGHANGLYLHAKLEAPIWFDLIDELVSELNEEHLVFRKAVLPHLTDVDYEAQLTKLKELILESADFDRQFETQTRKFSANEPTDHHGKFFDNWLVDKVDLSTKVSRRLVSNFNLGKSEGKIILHFDHKEVELDGDGVLIIEKLLETDVIDVDGISETLASEAKITWVKQLIKEGFLKIYHD